MPYLGEYLIDEYVTLVATTHRFSSGAAYAPTSITYRVYEDSTNTEIISDAAMTNFDSVTGLYLDRVQCTAASGFENGKHYTALIQATVDGVAALAVFTWRVGPMPVNVTQISGDGTAADNLEAACDGGTYNVGGGAVVAASVTAGVAIAANQDVRNVTGNVTGSVGSVTGAVGSVTGAVGSVTGAVGSVTAAVTVGTNNDKTGYSLASAPPTAGAIADAVWDEARSGHTTDGTFGQGVASVQGNVTGTVAKSPATLAAADVTGNLPADLKAITAGVDFSDTMKTALSAATPSVTVTTNNDKTGYSLASAPPTAEAIADQVWNEAIGDHLTAGSTGNALNAAGSAGDPWSTPLPGAYGTGTAGKIVGDNINATISSRSTLTAQQVWEYATRTVSTFGTLVSDVATAVWGAVTRSLTDKAGFTLHADYDAAKTAAPAGTALSNATWTDAKAGYIDVAVSSRLATAGYTAPDNATITAISGYLDTEVAAIKAKTDNLPAAPAATGDIPAATAVADAVLGRNIAGGSNGGRTVTSALRALRNKTTSSGGTLTVYQEDDTTSAWTASLTTDATADPITEVDPS